MDDDNIMLKESLVPALLLACFLTVPAKGAMDGKEVLCIESVNRGQDRVFDKADKLSGFNSPWHIRGQFTNIAQGAIREAALTQEDEGTLQIAEIKTTSASNTLLLGGMHNPSLTFFNEKVLFCTSIDEKDYEVFRQANIDREEVAERIVLNFNAMVEQTWVESGKAEQERAEEAQALEQKLERHRQRALDYLDSNAPT